jgi:chemotaxis protein CheC
MEKGPLKLTDFQLDALKEVGNVGAGNAATALSQMLGRRIDMSISKVSILSTESIQEFLTDPPEDVAAIYLPFYGDISGVILVFFTMERLPDLSAMLVGSKLHSAEEISELEKSALKELGSILSGAYLNALFKLIQIQMIHGLPTLIMDMAPAILDTVLVELENREESAIFIETELFEAGKKLDGSFFLIPEAGGLAKLFNAFAHSLGIADNG